MPALLDLLVPDLVPSIAAHRNHLRSCLSLFEQPSPRRLNPPTVRCQNRVTCTMLAAGQILIEVGRNCTKPLYPDTETYGHGNFGQ